MSRTTRRLTALALLAASTTTVAGLAVASAASEPNAPAPVTSVAAASTYTVDSVHSTALFRVQHLGAGQFWGRFNDLSGTMTFDPANPAALNLDIDIAIKSVDSGNDNLDKHLNSPDFFNAKEYPTMSFDSTSAKKTGERMYLVTGDITIRDVTKSIQVEVEWTGTHDAGRGERCGLEARFTIKRSEFGVNYGVENGALGDSVKVIVGLEGTA